MLRTMAVAILIAIPSLARADMGMLPGGDTLKFNRLWLHESTCTGYCSAVEDNLFSDNMQCFDGSGTCGGSQDKQLPINGVTSPLYAFNFAHCECSRAWLTNSDPTSPLSTFYEGTYTYELQFAGTTQVMKPLDIWVGTSCDDNVQRPLNCHQITNPDPGITYISQLMTTGGYAYPEVPFYDVMTPAPADLNMGLCQQRTLTTAEWGLAAINSGTYDFSVSVQITADSQPPPIPDSFTAQGAESAIEISWTPPSAGVGDVFAYQALCEILDDQGNETPAKTSHPAPKYQTSRMLCGTGTDATDPHTYDLPDDGTGVDATPASAGYLMARLDPTFICAEADDPTATSLRIDGLQNGQSYVVTWVATDKAGNSTAVTFTRQLKPKPAKDFWQDLHDRGSGVEGGFCLIADTYGDDNPLTQALRGFRDDTLAHTVFGRALIDAYYATLGQLGWLVHGHLALRVIAGVLLLPLVAFALAWHALTLPGLVALLALVIVARRRRWKLRLPRWATAAALVLVPARAFAQMPYWETGPTDTTTLGDEESTDVDWHAGLRLGPYIPQIDKQFGMTPGPYEQMFGSSSSWLPMFDVDRTILRRYGLVMVGLSAGYMSKSAHAWAVCQPDDLGCIDTPGDPNRTRSKGDTNSFHLLPLALTASYRYTLLDDNWGVPVVPYLRGGLAYYVWWVDGPNGSVSTVGSNSAKGASLGLVGSLGVQIRAERIDADAARSMRDSGIEHAGFFAEVQAAWVNGFGKSSKLSVGDNTWFAGVDFEF